MPNYEKSPKIKKLIIDLLRESDRPLSQVEIKTKLFVSKSYIHAATSDLTILGDIYRDTFVGEWKNIFYKRLPFFSLVPFTVVNGTALKMYRYLSNQPDLTDETLNICEAIGCKDGSSVKHCYDLYPELFDRERVGFRFRYWIVEKLEEKDGLIFLPRFS